MEPSDVPIADLVSYAFDAQTKFDEHQPLYIDAEQPDLWLSASLSKSLIKTIIAGLQGRGLCEGDSVLLCVGNHYLYPALFFAIVGAGGVVCPANPAYHFTEFDHICQLSTPRFVITNRHALPTVREVCQKRGLSASQIFVLDAEHPALMHPHDTPSTAALDPARQPDSRLQQEQTRLVSDLTSHGQRPWTTFPDNETSKTTPAVYFVTSGTTGLPKLAVISHFSLIFQNQAATQEPAAPYPVIRLACLPLFHIFGAAWALIPPLRYGQPVYIAPRYPGLAAYAHQIHAFSVTETYMAPPMVHALLNNAAEVVELAALLTTLRYVGVGGAPISAAALSALRGRLLSAGAVVSQVWGMTEFGPAALFRRGDGEEAGDVDLNSVGRLLPGYEVRFLEVGGVDLRDGPGSLYVRTPAVMLGYRGMPMGEDERVWCPTGDLGCVRDGMLYITGRTKEMIKVKGWQVSPAELEAVILRHPHISDCAVVGVKTADGLGEAPRAFVVPKKGSDLSQELLTIDVCNLVQRELSSYKSLETVVCVRDIPRTLSGKTQRYKLLQGVA